MPGKATSDELDSLHAAVAKALLNKIIDATGNLRDRIDPRDLATAARFLKDNGRETPPAPESPLGALDRAAASLPVTDEPYDEEKSPQ